MAGNIIGMGGPWSEDFGSMRPSNVDNETVDRVNRCWEVGVGLDLTWMPAEDVRAAVREYVTSAGIDFAKYSSSAHGRARFLAFSANAQRAIVDEAHAAGLTAQACALSTEALRAALDAGVDLLQHADITVRHEIPDATIAEIAARQIPCVAFLDTEAYLASRHSQYGGNARIKDANGRKLIDAGAKLMHAHDAGLLGPSAASSPNYEAMVLGEDVPWELGTSHIMWAKAALERGMSPMNVLLSMTRNVAQGYHKSDELGTIETAKVADILVIEEDPLADPKNYGRIRYVIKNGGFVDREILPQRPILTG